MYRGTLPAMLVLFWAMLLSVVMAAPRVAVYVQTFHDVNGKTLRLLPLQANPTGITHIIMASVHLNSTPGDIHLNDNKFGDAMFSQAWSDAKTLQAAGIKVMAMLGGWGDQSFNRLESNFDSYYQPLLSIIKQYNLDGLDLDIELDTSLANALQLIKALYRDMGPDFIITMAPVASAMMTPTGGDLSGFSYFDLDSQAVTASGDKMVSWYNVQFYSGFGSAASPDDYTTIIEAGWDPNRIVLGVLDNSSDGSGEVALTPLDKTIAALAIKYPTFGGVDGWEYFNAGHTDSLNNPWQWVQSVGTATKGTTKGTKGNKRTPISRIRRGHVGQLSTLPRDLNTTDYPPAPFPVTDITRIVDLGATWYEAVRALNLTEGNVGTAEVLYENWISS